MCGITPFGHVVAKGLMRNGRDFAGHADSIQAGSRTDFCLLPAENAIGNYVKVVQRVPMTIGLDNPTDVEFGPGMSMSPSVKIQ